MNIATKMIISVVAFPAMVSVMIFGCRHIEVQQTIDPLIRKRTNLYNAHLVDTTVSMLHTGDVVLRRGTGADSYLLAMLNHKDKTYSHCGIVLVEHGYPFVYHAIGGEDNPDARLRRDSASRFFSPAHNTMIALVRFDYDSDVINNLRMIVTDFYRQRPKFDLKFDLATDSALYCSEFAWKSINRATGDSAYIGASSISGNRFVGIDDLFINRHARLVWQTKFKQYLYTQK